MKTNYQYLKIPFTPQGKNSGNCGPCSLKMIGDYFNLKAKDGRPLKVHSLNRLCKVSTAWGCEKSDMARVLKRMGLKRQKIKLSEVRRNIKLKRPILSLFVDEDGGGHYAVIKGVVGQAEKTKLIFQDSYWGKNYKRDLNQHKKQLKPFQDWLWAIYPEKN